MVFLNKLQNILMRKKSNYPYNFKDEVNSLLFFVALALKILMVELFNH